MLSLFNHDVIDKISQSQKIFFNSKLQDLQDLNSSLAQLTGKL